MKTEKVKTGIASVTKQIINLSESILSVPVPFLALVDQKRRPGLARALVHITM